MNGQIEILVPSQEIGHETGVLLEFADALYSSGKVKYQTAYSYYVVTRTLARYLHKRRCGLEAPVDEIVLPSPLPVGMFSSITKDEWEDYLFYYQYMVKESAASLAFRITVFHRFFSWLSEKYGLQEFPFIMATKRPLLKTRPIRIVTDGEIKEILKSMDGEFRSRNVAILLLVTECGLGADEISELDLEDLELHQIRIRGYNRKVRYLPLPENCQMAIDRYIPDRLPPLLDGNPLFVSRKQGRLRYPAMKKMLTKAVRKAPHLNREVGFRELQQTWSYHMAKEDEDSFSEYGRSQSGWYIQDKYNRLKETVKSEE